MTVPALRKVQVWIHRANPYAPEGEPLVLLLKLREERGGYWQPVRGGVEPGETLEIAAAREAAEETGLVFRGAPRDLHVSFTYENARGRFEEHGFGLEALNEFVALDPREHVDSQWIGLSEASSLVHHESNRDVLQMLEFLLQRPARDTE